MTFLLRRVAATTAVLALSASTLAVCAGWQATAEARMECCKNGTYCPMHESESHGSDSSRVVSQPEADDCCAAAPNRTQSPQAVPSFVLASWAALPALVTAVVHVDAPGLQDWRVLVPLRASSVPTHLLLSVLLV